MTAAPAAPPQPPSEAVLDEPQPETQEPAKSGETSGDQEQLEALTTLARVDETMPSFDKAPPEQAPEQMAQAQPQPEIVPAAPPQPHVGISKSRPDGAAEGKGFVGFVAMEHELGPYLKEVRDRVERNWRAALEMRFSGVARTSGSWNAPSTPRATGYVKCRVRRFATRDVMQTIYRKAAPFRGSRLMFPHLPYPESRDPVDLQFSVISHQYYRIRKPSLWNLLSP